MPKAGRDGLDAGGEAGDVHRGVPVYRGPVAELASPVIPPALHAARVEHSTGVLPSSHDGLHTGGEAGDVHRRHSVNTGPVAELAPAVVPPASHATRVEHGAGMSTTSRDGLAGEEAKDVHRRRLVHRGPVAELATVVVPPALHDTGCEHGAGVGATSRDGLHAGGEAKDVDRR